MSLLTTTNKNLSTAGEILLEEFLIPLGISQYRLAKAISKSESAISEIVHNKRSVTPEMSWLLGEALGVSHSYFLNLETTYQMKSINEKNMPPVQKLRIVA